MMAAPQLHFPPGFRFHPTDEELVVHYLCRKCLNQQSGVPIITEIDLYKYDPWDLPGMALYGEKEWYFFSPRNRKYPNGSRPNRSAGTGYWKATGADKPIGKPKPVGIKKALVFYAGKAPKGEKTNWIMHEYRLAEVDRSIRRKNSLRLDDWVLCRIYNKKRAVEKQPPVKIECSELADEKPAIARPYSELTVADCVNFEGSDSVPRLLTMDSSCSEQVVSPEPASEVQSEPKRSNTKFEYNYVDANLASQFHSANQMSPLQDIFMYLSKPF